MRQQRGVFLQSDVAALYGHVPSREAGMATHYWQNNLAGELFWHMLGQVVIRPEECAGSPKTASRS